jgi:cell division protease FtsH
MQFGQAQGGNVFLGRDFNSEQNYSDAIAYEIDQEMQTMIKEQYARTKEILTEKRELLELIATTLLEVETLDAGQIMHLKEHGTLPVRPVKDSVSEIVDVETEKVDEVTPDVTGAPNDPSIADLPKEETTVEPSPGIKEDRK